MLTSHLSLNKLSCSLKDFKDCCVNQSYDEIVQLKPEREMRFSLAKTMLVMGKLRFVWYIYWKKKRFVLEIQWDYGKYSVIMLLNSQFTY